jgi:carnitine 3-dehydrogenase
MAEQRTVAVLGTGTIGASWTALFLAHGLQVRAWDPAPDAADRLTAFVELAWPALARLGSAPNADRSSWSFHADPAEAVLGASFVQENAPERLDVKRELLGRLEGAMGADAILASSSSGLLPSDIQAAAPFAARVVVGHPFNPPHLIPLVEVVGGRETDPATIEAAMAFYRSVGRRPIRLNKEVPGHLVNRLQAALWREAVDAVATGLASVEDVDAGIAYGPGLRWALMGPHMTFHLAGGGKGMPGFMEHFAPAIEHWWADMRQPTLTEELKAALIAGVEIEAAGRTPSELAAERDRRLVLLLQALHQSPAA